MRLRPSSPPPSRHPIRPRRSILRGRWAVFALAVVVWAANTVVVLGSPDGADRWTAGRVLLTTALLGVLGIVTLRFHRAQVARERRSNADLARLANTDPLTGLANRRAFSSRLEEEV